MENPTSAPVLEALTPAEEKAVKLYVLAVNLRATKDKEESAKANRIAIEEKIAALIPGKETGQETVTLKDGSKVVIKRGLNYKADLERIEEALATYDVREFPAPTEVKTTRKLDVKGYEWYKVHHPGVFTQIAQHVIVTPKKVSVTLEPAKEK